MDFCLGAICHTAITLSQGMAPLIATFDYHSDSLSLWQVWSPASANQPTTRQLRFGRRRFRDSEVSYCKPGHAFPQCCYIHRCSVDAVRPVTVSQ